MFYVVNDWKGGSYPCKIAWILSLGMKEYQKQQKRESNCICFNFLVGIWKYTTYE